MRQFSPNCFYLDKKLFTCLKGKDPPILERCDIAALRISFPSTAGTQNLPAASHHALLRAEKILQMNVSKSLVQHRGPEPEVRLLINMGIQIWPSESHHLLRSSEGASRCEDLSARCEAGLVTSAGHKVQSTMWPLSVPYVLAASCSSYVFTLCMSFKGI